MRLYILLIVAAIAQSPAAQNSAPAKPCSSPACSQFDFWLGNWDLAWGDTSKGTNTIRKLFGDCVINENFNDPAGNYSGMSWSVYNTRTMKWQQTWVDNQGAYILLSGAFKNGEMILTTPPYVSLQKRKVISRMVYYHIAPDNFDWRWESSTDNGKTWKQNWKIHYQRKK